MQRQLFKTAAALLEAGLAETRTHAKRMIFALKRAVPASAVATLQQQCANPVQERRVVATLELLGPPEAPPRLAESFAAVLGWDAAAAYAQHLRTQIPLQERVSDASSDQPQGVRPQPSTLGRAASGALRGGSSSDTRPQRSTSVHSGFRAAASSSLRAREAVDQQDVSIRGGSLVRTPPKARAGTLRNQASGSRRGASVGPAHARRAESSIGIRVGRAAGGDFTSVW